MKKIIFILTFCLLTVFSYAQIDTTGAGSAISDIDIKNIINFVFHLLNLFGIDVKFQATIVGVVLLLWHWAYKRILKSKHKDELVTAKGMIPEKKSFFKRLFGKK